jgi:hypothetical protein
MISLKIKLPEHFLRDFCLDGDTFKMGLCLDLVHQTLGIVPASCFTDSLFKHRPFVRVG